MYGTTPASFVHVHYVIIEFRKRVARRPLRLTWALFTPGQTGNSISTNYHSFCKKDKCKREPNRCGRHYLKLHTRDVTGKRKIYKRVYALSCTFDLPWRGRFFFYRWWTCRKSDYRDLTSSKDWSNLFLQFFSQNSSNAHLNFFPLNTWHK